MKHVLSLLRSGEVASLLRTIGSIAIDLKLDHLSPSCKEPLLYSVYIRSGVLLLWVSNYQRGNDRRMEEITHLGAS